MSTPEVFILHKNVWGGRGLRPRNFDIYTLKLPLKNVLHNFKKYFSGIPEKQIVNKIWMVILNEEMDAAENCW